MVVSFSLINAVNVNNAGLWFRLILKPKLRLNLGKKLKVPYQIQDKPIYYVIPYSVRPLNSKVQQYQKTIWNNFTFFMFRVIFTDFQWMLWQFFPKLNVFLLCVSILMYFNNKNWFSWSFCSIVRIEFSPVVEMGH